MIGHVKLGSAVIAAIVMSIYSSAPQTVDEPETTTDETASGTISPNIETDRLHRRAE